MRKAIFQICALLVVTLTIPAIAAAGQMVPGVSDKEVVVGWTTPLSGPAALWGVTAMGGKAWADYINDQGGVPRTRRNSIRANG